MDRLKYKIIHDVMSNQQEMLREIIGNIDCRIVSKHSGERYVVLEIEDCMEIHAAKEDEFFDINVEIGVNVFRVSDIMLVSA